ncbi:MAG: chorismate mutase [Candidatus Bathyarchaeota archaeon]|nr:chorismate mutase [Candidatus Bathyarchaeota archaeon]
MSDLKELRSEIDSIDQQILRFLADRVKVCEVIGSTKKAQKLPIKDAAREKEVYLHITEQAAKLGLDPAKVEAVYREIVNMCSSVQE